MSIMGGVFNRSGGNVTEKRVRGGGKERFGHLQVYVIEEVYGFKDQPLHEDVGLYGMISIFYLGLYDLCD